MKKLSQKQGYLIFFAFDALLLLLLLISFLPFFGKKTSSLQTQNSALLHPESKEKVKQITISNPNSELENQIRLEKYGDIWLGSNAASRFTFFWPVDSQVLDGLFEKVCKVQSFSVLAEKVSSWKELGVEEKNAIRLTFYDENSNILSSVFFGHDDALNAKIAFRTWTHQTVYASDSEIQPYLTTDTAFWVDPFIFPQSVTEYSRTEAEKLLRHGQLENISPAGHLSADFSFHKDFENGAEANFSVYKKDDAYIVLPTFKAGPAFSEKNAEAISKINYRYRISAWTFDSFSESF